MMRHIDFYSNKEKYLMVGFLKISKKIKLIYPNPKIKIFSKFHLCNFLFLIDPNFMKNFKKLISSLIDI